MKLTVVRRAPSSAALQRLAHLPPVLARAYAARGIEDPAQLSIGLDRLLPVGTLEGIEAAVRLLLQHRERRSRILVVGDFDADGATSSALIVRALRAWGYPEVDFLVPNRFEFGYGLTPEIVAIAAEREPALIITVDNGISSIAGVSSARERGIDVLVTDHHLAGHELPMANVIVNPNLAGATFGSRSLAGVGVAFYVMAALYRALGDSTLPSPATWLDLVALGTVADIVPLDQNNRVLVAQGLQRIRAGRCTPGVRALLETGGKVLGNIIATDLGFVAGPRINAAGRLDDMSIGIRCLLTDSAEEATLIAQRLDELNRERRSIEGAMQEQAMAAVRRLGEPGHDRRGVCLFDPEWHQGVVGLVAGRVKERVRRPVIAFARAGDGSLRGSARSVAGVHVRDVLEAISTQHPGLIVRFGGHAMAAGLTLEEEAGPWGQAFPEPSFDQSFRLRNVRIVGENHLKMWVELGDTGRRFDAIAFNALQGRPDRLDASGKPVLPDQVHLVYRLDINEWGGERRLQLMVDHLLESSP